MYTWGDCLMLVDCHCLEYKPELLYRVVQWWQRQGVGWGE
jgi:hypothetical protein